MATRLTESPLPGPAARPCWKGFNLCEMFLSPLDQRWPHMILDGKGRFTEERFRWMRDWGFNFVRLPLSYHWWSHPQDPLKIDPLPFSYIDEAISWGIQYGLHVNIAMHHAPGYCINQGAAGDTLVAEPFDLWKDPEAADCFSAHWKFIADRYRDVSKEVLSFNLVNEPIRCTREEHARVIGKTVDSIRSVHADRWIIVDGINAGVDPCPELAELEIIQSLRAYSPASLCFHGVDWADFPKTPTWPGAEHYGVPWDLSLLEQSFEPWWELQSRGAWIHCGEFGCFNRTPHEVALAWFRDVISIFNRNRIGYALWNLRGSFGIVDSGRTDIPYENFAGYSLDRDLLTALQTDSF